MFSNFTTQPIPSGCDIGTDLFLQKFFSYTAVIKTFFFLSLVNNMGYTKLNFKMSLKWRPSRTWELDRRATTLPATASLTHAHVCSEFLKINCFGSICGFAVFV